MAKTVTLGSAKDNEVVSIKQINEITSLIDNVNNNSNLIFNIW